MIERRFAIRINTSGEDYKGDYRRIFSGIVESLEIVGKVKSGGNLPSYAGENEHRYYFAGSDGLRVCVNFYRGDRDNLVGELEASGRNASQVEG